MGKEKQKERRALALVAVFILAVLVGTGVSSKGIRAEDDTTPPTVSVISPAGGSYVRGIATVLSSSSDNVGVTGVDFYHSSTEFIGAGVGFSGAIHMVSWNTTGVSDGQYALTAKAYDAASNEGVSEAVNVTVDNTAPSVAMATPSEGAYVKGYVQLTSDASDNYGINQVYYYRDNNVFLGTGSTASNHSYTWSTSSVSNGAHTLMAKAYDLAGNMTSSTTINVTVDNEAPVTSITSPSNNSYVRSNVSIDADASDNIAVSKVEFYRDGTTYLGEDSGAPYSFSLDTSTLSDGAHTLITKAYDQAGNVTTSTTVNITVDNTAPGVGITSPADGAYIKGTVPVTANASDNTSIDRVEFYYDGTNSIGQDSAAPYSVNWDTTTVSNGSHTLIAKAYDLAGNMTSSTTINMTVDNEAPVTAITFPTNGSTVKKRSNVTITATATDNLSVSKVEFYVNDVLKCTDTSSPYSCVWAVPNGGGITYNLKTKAYDTVNNIGTSSIVTVTSY